MSYHRAFIDSVKSGCLVAFLVSDDVTLYIGLWLYNRNMHPVEQVLNIRHVYGGTMDIEIGQL